MTTGPALTKRPAAMRGLQLSQQRFQQCRQQVSGLAQGCHCLGKHCRDSRWLQDCTASSRKSQMDAPTVGGVFLPIDEPPALQQSECLTGGAFGESQKLGYRDRTIAVPITPGQVVQRLPVYGLQRRVFALLALAGAEQTAQALGEVRNSGGSGVHTGKVSDQNQLDKAWRRE